MKDLGIAGRLAGGFIQSKLTPLIIAASILLGIGVVVMLPREEEPQIIVPMIDVMVQMPGSSSKEIEERVTKPMEKLLWEIPGVEYIYSTSSTGMSMAIVRFEVGQNEEGAIVRLNQKLFANMDLIPQGASQPIVKPRSIDDVPILALTLSSATYDHFTLRRVSAQLNDQIKEITDVSEVKLIGGQRRQVRVLLDGAKMSSRNISPAMIVPMLRHSNQQLTSGSFSAQNREAIVETGNFLTSAEDVGNVVVGVFNERPVFLRDVAAITDGPEEPADYVMFGHGAANELEDKTKGVEPAVTITVAKRKGTNAIEIAERVLEKIEALKGTLIPEDVRVTATRNYGETAAEKSNELLFHMLIAIASVSVLIMLALGIRESGIVAIAIPVTLALTLTVFYFYGYTLNRITLFALIFSIGILVDDAIVVVENMTRHYGLPENEGRPLVEVALEAVDEVGNPTILATFAVIAAILPMAFVSGLMGPYMRPIPIGASAAMIFSMIVAFVVTPWAGLKLLKRDSSHDHDKEGFTTLLYRRVMNSIIRKPFWRYTFLAGVVVLLLASMSLVFLKFTKVKMLPFDNKSEFQVIIDMPEGSTLEQTAAATRELAVHIGTVPEVVDYQMYVGTASPYNFNGLVRHYFLRRGPNVADIQVNLLSKDERSAQSHDIAKRVRPKLREIAQRYGARIKVAEVPPGPPVLQTVVAEIYGPAYERQIEIARDIRDLLDQTEGVVDVDWYVEDNQTKYNLTINKEKAAINGISAEQIAQTLRISLSGINIGLLHVPNEKEDTYINIRFPKSERSDISDLQKIKVAGNRGNLVPIRELVSVQEVINDKSIYHKNLMPVVYVTADVAGAVESPVYAILGLNEKIEEMKLPEGYALERYVAAQPFMNDKYAMKWDGEWHITYEVFRDLGIAFAVVMVLIYILVVGWFQSFKTPLTIMAAIPFSLVGILPAHALMGAFFTATSMIGFIAGAGIVVRNSIILVDFVEIRMKGGMPLIEAVVDAGAVRFRPMLLTAAAVIAGSAVILFDPIFQGLAISLMAGEVASLLLSRMAVPVLYFLSERKQHPALMLTPQEDTILCIVDSVEDPSAAVESAEHLAERIDARVEVVTAKDAESEQAHADEPDEVSDDTAVNREDPGQRKADADPVRTMVKEDIPAEVEESESLLISVGVDAGEGLGILAEMVLANAVRPVMFAGPNTKAWAYGDKDLRIVMFVLQSGSKMAFEFADYIGERMGAECSIFVVETGNPPTLREWDSTFDAAENESNDLDSADWAGLILEETKRKATGLIIIHANRNHPELDKFRSQLSDLVDAAECPVVVTNH
jgi:multidrug efflux pump subunit AcrB